MVEIIPITSRDNQKLKLAKRVREGKEPDLLFIEGLRLAEEALRPGLSVQAAFIIEDFELSDRAQRVMGELTDALSEIYRISLKLFRDLGDTENPQGIILLARRPTTGPAMIERNIKTGMRRLPIVLFLAEINNPSNLGAILRTAEAAGAAGVVVSKNSADAFSPKSLRASMGSAFRVPIWSDVVFDDALQWAKEAGLSPTATGVKAEKSYTEVNWRVPRLLVFGSEAHGLPGVKLEKLTGVVRIPMENGVESLNLAVSCGIILFEARRQMGLSDPA